MVPLKEPVWYRYSFKDNMYLTPLITAFFQGDVGGPLTITGKTVDSIPNARYCQTGIASAIAGDECESGFPTAFLRVSYFVDDFITNVTGIEPCIECSSYFQSSQSSGHQLILVVFYYFVQFS